MAEWLETDVSTGLPIAHEETAEEAVRAGIHPAEVAALFNEADIAREEASERPLVEPRVRFPWDKHGVSSEAYEEFAEYMDSLAGPVPEFNFRTYAQEHPYRFEERSSYRIAEGSTWGYAQLKCTATEGLLVEYRAKYKIPPDVHIYVPAPNERPDQPPRGMVAFSAMVMDAGLRLPLPFAVSHMLNAFNVAPLQLSAIAWLQAMGAITLYGSYRLYRNLTPSELIFLFKFSAIAHTSSAFSLQGRSGKVLQDVPEKAHGDPSRSR
ncbi:hypothetical protein OROMI_016709 [Orobanche minor]